MLQQDNNATGGGGDASTKDGGGGGGGGGGGVGITNIKKNNKKRKSKKERMTEGLKNRTVVALARLLQNNKVLFHLNLSYNHLSESDTAVIAEGLNLANHTLMGLHYDGNGGWIGKK